MFSRLQSGDDRLVSRWAVLWDVMGDDAIRVGLATEHPDHVHVFVPPSFGVPSRFAGEYRVLQPDGSLVMYRPGMEGYFDQVLVDLSRRFSVGKQGVGPQLDRADLIKLFVAEVAAPSQRTRARAAYPAMPAKMPAVGVPPKKMPAGGMPRKKVLVFGVSPTKVGVVGRPYDASPYHPIRPADGKTRRHAFTAA